MKDELFSKEKLQILNRNFRFQRWFYSFIGIGIISVILILTYEQIHTMKKENHEFAFCLLLIIHSICALFSILATAIFCRLTNALLTTITIILLSAYTGIHFYIRFLLFSNHSKTDFYLITIRLGLVVVLLILFLPWTNAIVHKYRIDNPFNEEIIYPRSTTFSWFLYLDFLLIISLFILNIRNQIELNSSQMIFIGIGISLALIWLCLGILIANNKLHHWFISIVFHILSFLHIIYIGYMTYKTISEYNIQPKVNSNTLFPLFLLIFICSGTNFIIHILTMIISFVLMDKI
ncbi:hypothetical protein I4U23_018015 [Adineta vaga]|nr:hypothetical protein I4U23_018015 [Adineta vaga]